MKYNIFINQQAAVELKLDVDMIDLAIFDMLKDYTHAPVCKRMQELGKTYFSVPYRKVIDELPLMPIKTPDGVYRRFKKLEQAAILEMHPENAKLSMVWFAWGRNYTGMIRVNTPGFKSEGSVPEPSDPRMNIRTPPDKYPTHNNTIPKTNKTLSDSQAKSDRKRKTKVDTGACPSADQADDAYTFAEFWNDYGHKVGSKTKTEAAFGKLSHQDKMSIRATLPLYLRSTVTKDTARVGGTFRPFRQHPLTYINGRMWKTYEDQATEQNEQATPYDDNYRSYLEWVQRNFPAVLQQTAQLSKPQFVTYKSTSYVRGVRDIGGQAELNTLRRAHEEFTTNTTLADKYPDVFTYHCSLIERRLKARQV